MPNPVDVVTNQVRGFIATAMAEAVAAERTAARAAELERVRQVANKLLLEGIYLEDPAVCRVASQAFDDLFRRLADSNVAPVPAVLNRPDEPGGPFADNSPEAIDERQRLRELAREDNERVRGRAATKDDKPKK
jgi:hypothetical protein